MHDIDNKMLLEIHKGLSIARVADIGHSLWKPLWNVIEACGQLIVAATAYQRFAQLPTWARRRQKLSLEPNH
jgi:hypothetical protein